jgi:hypothetical protein
LNRDPKALADVAKTIRRLLEEISREETTLRPPARPRLVQKERSGIAEKEQTDFSPLYPFEVLQREQE